MKTNKYRKRIKKTRKNIKKDTSILTEKEKTMNEVINDLEERQKNDRLNDKLVKMFQTPFTTNNLNMTKNDFFSYINESWIKEISMSKKENIKYLIKVDNFQVAQYKPLYR